MQKAKKLKFEYIKCSIYTNKLIATLCNKSHEQPCPKSKM